VSWEIASYVLLGLALAAGFAWYDRARPPSRVVALVAALAALAALGRIAFAPVPNVKPTTDIALLAGYALGGAPGFVVGAVAALTSNFFFGQGPWTPWQMLAWGGTGLLGALVARVAGDRVGRWPLAIVCFAAGLGFGAILDFSQWLIYSGGHTWSQFLAENTSSFPWNMAHAIGNLVFCLLFGPALVRALRRFRTRFDVTWRLPASATLPLVALVVAIPLLAAPRAQAATPSDYLATAQHADGGWGAAPGGSSAPLYSAWAALGLAAQGRNPADVARPGGKSALDYLRATVGQLRGAGDIERTILVAGAAGASPRAFGGKDLVRALLAHRRRNGSIDGQVNLTAFGIYALKIAHVSVTKSARWLQKQADRDGGFNFGGPGGPGGTSDSDDTGAAIEALAAGGKRNSTAARRAVAYLVRTQDADGGFAATAGGPSNAQSTAFAIQGLVAAGRDPAALHRGGGRSPLDYLRTLTASDGSVRYSRSSAQTPVWVTGQAALALARKPFPLPKVKRAAATVIRPAGALSFVPALGALCLLVLRRNL
jgi:energy-coupling factor transport system substrate-specific component